jgi:hypothetical protein
MLWCLVFSGELSAQILENYSDRFEFKSTKSWSNSLVILNASVDVANFSKSSLWLSVPAGSTVFVEKRIWFFTEQDTSVIVTIDWLKDYVDLPSARSLEFSISNNQLNPQAITLKKGYFDQSAAGKEGLIAKEAMVLESRGQTVFKDFYFIALGIILLLLAIIKGIFPVELSYFLAPRAVISSTENLEGGQKFFSVDVLFFLLTVGMALVLGIMFFIDYFEYQKFGFFNPRNLNDLFFKWFIGSLIYVFVTIAKFVYLKFLSSVFKLNKLEFLHFFYLLRIISLMLFGLLILQTLFLTNNYLEVGSWVELSMKGFFSIYILGIVFLFVFMTNQVNFNFYHLIAYLCTAELLPFLIVSKYIIS